MGILCNTVIEDETFFQHKDKKMFYFLNKAEEFFYLV